MEKLGYFISEAPVFFLIFWFAFRLVQLRRYFTKRPIVTEADRQLLHGKVNAKLSFKFLHKFTVATLIVALSGYLEVMLLAPFGAAIMTATVFLTSASVVHRLFLVKA
jgi:hypothetical protein